MTNKKMTTQLEQITPAIASEILAKNEKNRRVDDNTVALYAAEMSKGNWKTTSQSISIDWNGNLINGQHRLKAIIKSGVTVTMSVTRNEDPDNFKTMDTLKVRSTGTMFDIAGIANATNIACIIKYEYLINKSGYITSAGNAEAKITATDELDVYNSKPEYYQNVHNKAGAWYSKLGHLLSLGYLGAYYIVFSKKNEKKAESFFEKLVTGLNIDSVHDPVYVLRNKLITNAGATTKYSKKYINAFIIKAWNLHVAGKMCKILKHSDTDEFPKILSK